MKKYLLAIFFLLGVQNVNAEVSAITGGGSSFTSEVSSTVYIPSAALTQLSGVGACFANSTATLTLNGGVGLEFIVSGEINNSVATASIFCTVLEDGANIDSYTNTTNNAMWRNDPAGASAPIAASMIVKVKPRTAGAHSYCLTCAGSTGTITLGANARAYFTVKEPAH